MYILVLLDERTQSTDTKKVIKRQFDTTAEVGTEAIAEKIGVRLQGGETIELISDVGGGKTTFVRGLARGAGSADPVASPTFTVSRVYETEAFSIYHFDLYKAYEPGILAAELDEAVKDKRSVVVIEWGAAVAHVLPDDRLRITFNKTGDLHRSLAVEAPEAQVYLLEEL